MRYIVACSLPILAAMAGCASVATDCAPQQMQLTGKQTLSFTVVNAAGVPTGAECVFTNDKGRWEAVAPNTTSVEVARSREEMKVQCVSPGYLDGTLTLVPRTVVFKKKNEAVDSDYAYPEKIEIMLSRGRHAYREYPPITEDKAKCSGKN